MESGIQVRVGLLGCGHVGGALVRLLTADRDRIATRTGLRLELAAVAVRSVARERDVALSEGLLTTDAQSVVVRPDIDVVVEVIGGIEPARTLILAAIKAGKPVVTANKELLANCGSELFEAASTAGVDLLFEASVAGAIPLIRPLRESLAGERIRRVTGIVNGTTNFILSRMSESAVTYHDALAEAQGLGYAERDPTADVEGFDAAAKAAILANVAFGARVVAGDVYREGISAITSDDIAMARRLGFAVKLLAVVEQDPVRLADGSPAAEDGSGGA
ncbi:MAG: homoserine dehydrogenase, partial [Acidimicrobiales bacterium]